MIIALQTLIFFRESLLTALDRLLRPYYNRFSLTFNRNGNDSDDDESDEQVFADYDDEKGVVFYPPMYAQRYAAVSDCLLDERWVGKLEKVADLGHHDMSFIKYLKDVPGIRRILGVDIETIPLRCSSDLLACDNYVPRRENPLNVTLYQGNAADPDYRLIGCDAVIAIEMIEHMLPHDLDRLVHTVFGFIKPWVVIFTTPNGDFNVLFKSLEKNGLRRLDHFFEWSREQYHDWCSNIVVRYPQYTVTCKGIGPGPPGTEHIGCCTQMALFISKDYQKQQDLTINSLALVANPPSQNNISDEINNWDLAELITENNMICPPSNMESYTELLLSNKQSRITIMITTPDYSIESIGYQDKTSQCNLDTELGRSYLMFDDEQMCFNVLVPRRKFDNRVYEIEDVASRLNCTTLQVKKFSKATQNLMARNKSDSLLHTREVVNEIRNLTKMLNFNKDSPNREADESHPWCNINWGENAPYWNQYYKIVREYNYPFEVKSDDSRMLDLISEEINSLVDTQYDDEYSSDMNKLEIPLQYLMKVVSHITDDVDRVKDLLEWNGYEIVDEMVIHTRLVDTASVATYEEEWQDDTLSDCDTTDFHSTTMSDGSTVMPDYHGRCLRRALDHKLRRLRSMLTADEDISSELDRVVCRLMKLALRTSKGRDTAPPTRWMQTKLLDLLTLTEKSIDRRKRHFIETYPLKEVEFDSELKKEEIEFDKIKEDHTAKEIVNKYRHLVHALDEPAKYEGHSSPKYGNIDLELEDELSEISDFEYINRPSPDLVYSDDRIKESNDELQPVEFDITLERTQAWIEEENIEVVPYPNHDYGNTSDDSNNIIDKTFGNKYKNTSKRYRGCNKNADFGVVPYKKVLQQKKSQNGKNNKEKIKSVKVIKKLTQKKSSYSSLLKSSSSRYLTIKISSRKVKPKKYKEVSQINYNRTDSNISCHEDETIGNKKYYLETSAMNDYKGDYVSSQVDYNISATEESCFIGIVMDGVEETIALHRTIGTDAEVDIMDMENETLIHDIDNDLKGFYIRPEVSTENVQSQTIFLNDINEPSTSKGIRHGVNTDVQCGTDISAPFPTLSATTSFSRLPKTCNNGIKIGDSITNVQVTSTEFGTCTYECDVYGTLTLRRPSPGIRIQDSDKCIAEKTECSTMTQAVPIPVNEVTPNYGPNETKCLKSVASNMKNEDSSSEFCGSVYSFPKSLCIYPNSINTSEVQIKTSLTKEVDVSEVLSVTKYVRPKLSCGGVHIHAYRDKQVSEDVVFQGDWQKYRPKTHVKRKPLNSFVVKKGIEPGIKRRKVNSKEKISNTVTIHIKPDFKKPVYLFAVNNTKPKQEKKKEEKVIVRNTSSKTVRPIKVASKLNVSSNAMKIPKVTFAKKIVAVSSAPVKKDNDKKPTILKKNYIPGYLRKKDNTLPLCNKQCLNSSIDTVKTTIKENEILSLSNAPPLIRSKTEEIKRNLLKFNLPPRGKVEYMVFHNEIDNKSGTSSNQPIAITKNYNRRDNSEKKPQSPQSQNSSTCSSPSSVATVRITTKKIKNLSSRRNSTSSNKCNSASGSGTPSPTRPKKFTKRCKSAKKVDDYVINNKENIPESARKCNLNKEVDKTGKTVFLGSHKSVYIAQLTTDNKSSVNTSSKSRTHSNKSNIKIPKSEAWNDKQKSSSSSIIQKPQNDVIYSQVGYSENQILISKSSVVTRNLEINNIEIKEKVIKDKVVKNNVENRTAIFEGDMTTSKSIIESSKISLTKAIAVKKSMQNNTTNLSKDNGNKGKKYYSKNLGSTSKPPKSTDEMNTDTAIDITNRGTCDYSNSNITKTIKEIIEDSLDFIDKPFYDDSSFDSATVVLSLDDVNPSYDDCASLASFKTIDTNDDYFESIIESDLENALNRTLDSTIGEESVINLAETSFTLTDVDLLSFKSVPSVSKLSEYFLNNNEFKIDTTDNNTFRELFERKDLQMNQKLGGVLAIQAFSGFSINVEPVAGDQPDHVNFIDSETASLTLEFNRQATSEELFVSGRSSDSYESCLIDEDAVVPNWLFQIISQQQSANEQPEQMELIDPLPLDMSEPLAEPLYDANGNLVEPGVGAGAGAGDGRGIHSDQSQDSSGRGSSLSSSNTSSEPRSEAIIIDPSAFTTQFEFLGEPLSSGSMANPILNPATGQLENLMRVDEVPENEVITLRVPTEGPAGVQMVASDGDADVSSLDTDVPDSSDN
ncbi:uncharacterized protein LOC115447932 isoform X2 [Manduca sexta]|uniref:uncharacterized protein LOC115447932 isoform X2 n=1 Tax=Manduca sexta TaxID=7130 RepID=UPI001890AB09|nr:uncharacterized protein LOC115447932 isoform X2 [Manduca sexta]